MGTDYKKSPLSEFSVHFVKEGEAGFNYYGYQHSSGQIIVMREEIATKSILYADGGFNLAEALTNRVSLSYKSISEL